VKKIVVNLSESSINQAIKDVKAYQKWIDAKTKILLEKLALVGAQEASVRFASAMYDGINDVSIEASPTSTGWMISARGDAVCFLEFGAGVYHNPGEPYPEPRPTGVVGIGEYGQKKGKRRGWKFYSESGELVFTRGTPATLSMWYATTEMQREVERIAREVFSGG